LFDSIAFEACWFMSARIQCVTVHMMRNDCVFLRIESITQVSGRWRFEAGQGRSISPYLGRQCLLYPRSAIDGLKTSTDRYFTTGRETKKR
jgi:hypothetical protein